MGTEKHLSVGEMADSITKATGVVVLPWRVTRLFELRLFPDPPRVGGRRVIPESLQPQLIRAMRDRGWIPVEAAAV